MARVLSLDFNIDNSHGTVCVDHGQTTIGGSERGGAWSVSVFNKQFAPCMYRLMLLGRDAPVVNARLPLTEACAHGLRGLWPQAEDRHRQHRLCIGVHNSRAGVRSATLRSHLHRIGGVVCDGPRPRPQSEETIRCRWERSVAERKPARELCTPIQRRCCL